MSSMKTTRTPEEWLKVDPLYLMQRVARGETSGTAAYNLLSDALVDIAALEQRCRELELGKQQLNEALRQSALSGLQAERERDTLHAELEQLRKDAERYRWLRDHEATCSWEEGETEVRNHPGLLDEAVDESIAMEATDA